VIVGAGAAGAAAAEKLRRLGYSGAITLVTHELPGPVDRPNLSKDFLAGAAPMEWVTLRDDAFYQGMKIELVRDEAVELDTQGQERDTARRPKAAVRQAVAGAGVRTVTAADRGRESAAREDAAHAG
jgi:NADPH-dependent 2,4-dienoyl-CoA reductase/sulfur reductase-like enzyme